MRAINIRKNIESLGETTAQKAVRFLAYANQSDWLCKQILRAMDSMGNEKAIASSIGASLKEFGKRNQDPDALVPSDYGEKLEELITEKPLHKALVNLADDWVVEFWKAAAQYPDHADWNRFQVSPLDGKLGVSFALQWRYNFGIFFRGNQNTVAIAQDF